MFSLKRDLPVSRGFANRKLVEIVRRIHMDPSPETLATFNPHHPPPNDPLDLPMMQMVRNVNNNYLAQMLQTPLEPHNISYIFRPKHPPAPRIIGSDSPFTPMINVVLREKAAAARSTGSPNNTNIGGDLNELLSELRASEQDERRTPSFPHSTEEHETAAGGKATHSPSVPCAQPQKSLKFASTSGSSGHSGGKDPVLSKVQEENLEGSLMLSRDGTPQRPQVLYSPRGKKRKLPEVELVCKVVQVPSQSKEETVQDKAVQMPSQPLPLNSGMQNKGVQMPSQPL